MTALDDDLLSSYLTEHYLAAASGVRAFDAAAKSWEGTVHETTLRDLSRDIGEDREELRALIESLGFEIGTPTTAAAKVGEVAGRLNPLNPLRQRRVSATQIELEALVGAVRTKRCLWETLSLLVADEPGLPAQRITELTDRAKDQEERIFSIISATARERFAPDLHDTSTDTAD